MGHNRSRQERHHAAVALGILSSWPPYAGALVGVPALSKRIVLTWLQIQLFEGLYASSMFESMTPTQGSYYQKRLDHAHRRHLSAIRTLSQIRKLGPAVQINIAEKQINTLG